MQSKYQLTFVHSTLFFSLIALTVYFHYMFIPVTICFMSVAINRM